MLCDLCVELNDEVDRLMEALNTAKAEIATLQTDANNTQGDQDDSAKTIDDLRDQLEEKSGEVRSMEDRIRQLRVTLERERSKRQQQDSGVKDGDDARKELAGKNRQIESLEEQLRRNTSAEIQRLKRGM